MVSEMLPTWSLSSSVNLALADLVFSCAMVFPPQDGACIVMIS
jgi:hypothetical protein